MLKIPTLRDLPIHFFDLKKNFFFNYKLFLLTNSSGYKKKNWLLKIVFLYLTVKEAKIEDQLRPKLSKKIVLLKPRRPIQAPFLLTSLRISYSLEVVFVPVIKNI